MKIVWKLAAYAVASIASTSVDAAMVNIKFSGTLQNISPEHKGEAFSGSIEYDPDQVLINFGTPKNPVYPYLGRSLTTTPYGTVRGNLQFVQPACLNERCRYSFTLFNRDDTLYTIAFVVPSALDIKTSLGGRAFAFTSYSSFTSPNGLGGVTTVGAANLFGTGVFSMQATAVPEPSTWALMLGGFGLMGVVLRYRRRKPIVAYA